MMTKKKKQTAQAIVNELSVLFPYAKIQLQFETPFQLLVATIISAQCTDERVNKVTQNIYRAHKTPADFANMKQEELEQLIFSTGYYKAKARHIIAMSKMLLEQFGGEVPGTMEELTMLPGVGRKTANVILGHIFDVPAIVVDTHVTRIANRLGLTAAKNPVKIEFELMGLVDEKYWVVFTHYMINFGRKICSARSPKCTQCPLADNCLYFKGNNQKKNWAEK